MRATPLLESVASRTCSDHSGSALCELIERQSDVQIHRILIGSWRLQCCKLAFEQRGGREVAEAR